MSRLEELIQQHCPDGVEYKKLGEICYLSRGKVYSKSYIEENAGEYPVYSSQTANNGELGRISTYDYDGEYLTWTTDGAYAGTIFYRNGKFSITNVCGLISIKGDNLLIKFLFYWLSIKAPDYVYRGMGNPKLMSNQMEPIKVPIPPLPVQEEIVRILDTFTELQAELQKRLQQYEYYRDKLLSFSDLSDWGGQEVSVEWKKLGEIGKVCMCKRILKDQTSSTGDIPFFKIGTFGGSADAYISKELFEEYVKKYSYPKKGDILISAAGTIGRTVVFDGTPSYFQDSNIVWLKHDESVVLNSYLRYIYSLNPWAISTGGTIARLYNDNILNAVIPVPPLTEQQRIVDILDRFNTLTTDITAGLPAEIEARRKQYEYYRDRLLTFKQKA